MSAKQTGSVAIPQECPLFEKCEATLCPRDSNRGKARWFPDEPICRAKEYQDTPWIKKQREVRRMLGRKSDTGFFTIHMLRSATVKPELRGTNPDELRSSEQRLKSKSRGEARKRGPEATGALLLIAIEYEGSPNRIRSKIEEVLVGSSPRDPKIKGIRFFAQQKTTSSPTIKGQRKTGTPSIETTQVREHTPRRQGKHATKPTKASLGDSAILQGRFRDIDSD